MSKLEELEQQLQEQQDKLNNLQSEIEKLKLAEQGNQWVPEYKDLYYFVSNIGRAMEDTWVGNEVDTDRRSIGNLFRTEKEAEFEAERRKVITELKKYTSEFVHGGDNCYMYYDFLDKDICYEYASLSKYTVLYFPSEKIARQAVQAVGEDRVKKYYLGVSE